jgi:hypothetical protein
MNTHDDHSRLNRVARSFALRSRKSEHARDERNRLAAESTEHAAGPEELRWDRAYRRWDALATATAGKIDVLLELTEQTVEEVVDPFLRMSLPELLSCGGGYSAIAR